MSTETVTIEVKKYRKPDGKHTCSLSVSETCVHYGTRRFGTIEVCTYGNHTELEREKEGYGFLIPKHDCPIGDRT